MERCYIRDGVWGWSAEAQEAKLREAGVLEGAPVYRDELSAVRARQPGRVSPEWLAERQTNLFRKTGRRTSETIHVATMTALAVREADLIAALAAAETRRATVVAHDTGVAIAPGSGMAGAAAAIADWRRSKLEAQTRAGRGAGNRKAAELQRAKTEAKLTEARPLWRDRSPQRLTADQVARQVGLSIPTLYKNLHARPEIGGPRVSSHVYVVGSDDGPMKIGIAIDPRNRLAELQVGHPFKLKVLRTWKHEAAAHIELAAHKILRGNRLQGEWFSVSPEEAIAAVERAIKRKAKEDAKPKEQS